MPTEDTDLARFAERLQSEVRDRALGIEGVPDFNENAFTEIVLDYLADIGMVDDIHPVFYEGSLGRGIGKLNAYGLDEDGDTLDVFGSVFLGTTDLRRVPREEIVRAVDRVQRVCQSALDGHLASQVEQASDVFGFAQRVRELGDRVTRIRLFILTDGRTQAWEENTREVRGLPVRVELWDIERLFRGMQAGLPREEIDIDFERDHGGAIPCLVAPTEGSDYQAYLALIPGEVLYRLYDEYGARLLELNVRSFLSARGKVNSGIRKTLKDEPERFLAYNNGIVLTVDSLELAGNGNGQRAIKAVRGLQVVNGGQTTASIHRAKKVDRADISAVLVPAKIAVIDPQTREVIVSAISRYANTQNVIQVADLSANDPFHIEIERLSRRTWCPGQQGRWFYERARGQFQEAKAKHGDTAAAARRFNHQTPPQRRFTKTDLAKFAHSWMGLPHLVSLGSQKNFEQFMHSLAASRSRDWVPDDGYFKDIVAQAIIFRTAEKIVRQAAFAAYRANIVTYLVAYLSYRSGGELDLERIWEHQELSAELQTLMRSWAFKINGAITVSAAGRNVTEWCKKPACWDHVRAMDTPLPTPLPVEFLGSVGGGGEAGTSRLSPVDYDNIERCRRVDGEAWLRIHGWGKQTGSLQRWQAGIAHTLAGYAANGWTRSPSAKQAKHGVRMLDLAAESGIFTPPQPPGD